MNAGDTLYIPAPGTTLDSHLWMIISDPEQSDECLLVNFTSWRADKDQACVINEGDHPYIAKKSCVNYKGSKLVKARDLMTLLNSSGRDIEKRQPLSQQLLDRIRQSVADSRMSLDHAQILIDQELVDC